MKNILLKILLQFFMFLIIGTLSAQVSVINGVVNDSHGKPIDGVAITTFNGKNKAVTGRDGQYTLNIEDNSSLVVFSYPGYRSQTVPVGNESLINISLQRAETYDLDETVFFGFSSQKKGDISGAVSRVKGKELESSPTANLSQSFAGRISGLYTYESYSEPSRAETTLRARGVNSIRANTPLIVIDGFPYDYDSNQIFEYISASEVESITLLKDASTQALYGIQGANGVLVITTKRGAQGKLKIDVKLDQTFEQTSTKPTFVNSADFVQLRNQAGYNDGNGEYHYFSERDVANFISGEYPDYYPNNNWREMFMKDFAHMQRANINLTGGNNRAVFYTNMNVMHQGGLWKTDQTKYKSNNDFLWVNFRSNVDVKLNQFLSASLNLSGNIKSERTPSGRIEYGQFASAVYYRMYTIPSYVYGPVTPEVVDPVSGEIIVPGGEVTATTTEPVSAYSVINRMGYSKYTKTNVYAQFALKADLGFITEGLNLAGYFGYQANAQNVLYNWQEFEAWRRTDYFDELSFVRNGTSENTPLAQGKGGHFYYNLNFKGILDYKRSFGNHNVSGMAYAFYQNLNKADGGSPALLPYKRLTAGVEATYNYADRYFLKLNASYSGSEQYSPENRFAFVPAVSAAWVVSNESFMDNAEWLSHLKLRASYGKAANDRSGLGRYVYLDNITLTQGAHIGYLGYNVTEGQAANPEIEPEISVKQNYGIDFSLFNNLAVSMDVFKERMENMVAGGTSITPSYQGIPLGNFPQVNSGIFENKGFEVTLDYTKAINSDLSFNIGGWLAYTENKVIYSDESERADDYVYRKRTEGFSWGQEFGYIVDKSNGNGYFNSQQELDESNLVYEIGNPRVGYLKYHDLNSDGIINEKDQAPLGFGGVPRYTYAFHGKVNYKNFDLSFLFQGVADYYRIHGGSVFGRGEWRFDGVYGDIHRNAWTAERYANGDKITFPALSVSSNSNHVTSDFYMEDKSYLRLKNLELGFTFPKSVSRLISADKIRLYVSGQNLFTWHKLDSDEYGPEGNYESIPVFRLYNVGLSVNF